MSQRKAHSLISRSESLSISLWFLLIQYSLLSVTVTNFFTSPVPLRLCRQIDAGTIIVIETTEIFEAEWGRFIIQERREYNRLQEIRGVGIG
jgi:hypothetical protein